MCRKVFEYLAVALAAFPLSAGQTNAFSWPNVAPLRQSFYFRDASKAEVLIHILGTDGKALYRIQCYPGADDPKAPDIYPGDFDCHLNSVEYEDKVLSLLVNEGPWSRSSRGVVKAWEVVAPCGDYPEYGRVRHFRLRGMLITFEYSNVRVEEVPYTSHPEMKFPELRSFQFTVSVKPDPTAVSSISESVPFAEPTTVPTVDPNITLPNCSRVLAQHVPGMVSEDYVREHALEPPYPQVATTEKTATFSVDKAQNFQLSIADTSGRQAYFFRCSAAIGEAGLARWGIRCELVQEGRKLDLLADSVDPYSRMNRAHIVPEQLDGKCAEYPGWGANRQFNLRGMELTIEVKNIVRKEGQAQRMSLYAGPIVRFDFQVDVKPDPNARSPVALPSNYVDWRFLAKPHACEQVLVRSGNNGGLLSGK